jgi:hypothetical protein
MINVFLGGAPRLCDLETIWKQRELRRRFGNDAKWQVRQIDRTEKRCGSGAEKVNLETIRQQQGA